uniref:peptidylprolyl isomerase n=1 Tax=Amorphochlora amoebiformis TaxID=1561963 RepID=A0A7S0GKU0_9EUKA|mmetsp:Transcript_11558/g.18279  ORF Transcript_11558/g.18279 Transcript_11558/m.18279 type:complete len:814 (+) Transcript_11558:128-2569(+)
MSTGSEIAAYRSSRTAMGARLRRRANILGISLIVSMYLTPSALVRGESKLELSARRRFRKLRGGSARRLVEDFESDSISSEQHKSRDFLDSTDSPGPNTPPSEPLDTSCRQLLQAALDRDELDSLSEEHSVLSQYELNKGYYLTDDGGVFKIIKRTAKYAYMRPKIGDSAGVSIEGFLENGTIFFSTRGKINRENKFRTFTIPLGQESLLDLPGLQLGLQSMQKGEISYFVLEPKYAFANNPDNEFNIPTNARVAFAVELMNIEQREQTSGFVKQILQQGNPVCLPVKEGDEIEMSYAAKLICGTNISQPSPVVSYGRKLKIVYGRNHSVQALNMALERMKDRETARVLSDDRYAPGNIKEIGSPVLPPHLKPPYLIEYDITLHSHRPITQVGEGLFVRRLEYGELYATPNAGASILVEISSRGPTDQAILKPTSKQFRLFYGSDEVPDVVERLLETMPVGEISEIYGENKRFKDTEGNLFYPHIDPEQQITFRIRLVDFKRGEEYFDFDVRGKVENAVKFKKEGDHMLKRGNMHRAKELYAMSLKCIMGLYPFPYKLTDGVGMLPEELEQTFFSRIYDEKGKALPKEDEEKVVETRVGIYDNLALICLREREYEKTKTWCEYMLHFLPNSPRALYRMGLAYLGLGDDDKAMKYLKEAREVCSDKEIEDAMDLLKRRAHEQANLTAEKSRHFLEIQEKSSRFLRLSGFEEPSSNRRVKYGIPKLPKPAIPPQVELKRGDDGGKCIQFPPTKEGKEKQRLESIPEPASLSVSTAVTDESSSSDTPVIDMKNDNPAAREARIWEDLLNEEAYYPS